MPGPLLEADGLTAFYGDFQALFGIDVTIAEGNTVAVIGANGAGKSTFLRAVTGLNRATPNAIRFGGTPIGGQPPERIVGLGIAMVPEGRRLFPSLSVEENLLMGALARRKGPWTLDRVYRLFPILKERRRSPATMLSGGQQQMVAIARALTSQPKLLMLDEPSMGLAPILVEHNFQIIQEINQQGTTIFMVEQNANMALSIAHRGYVVQTGRIVLADTAQNLLNNEQLRKAYLGR